MRKKNYYFLLMFVMMNIMAVATSTVKAEAWDGSWRTIKFESGEDEINLEFTAPEAKTYTFKSNTQEFGIKIKAVCGDVTEWSDALYDWFGATVSIGAKANEVIKLTVVTDGEEFFPVIVPMELVKDSGDDTAWDGTKKDITITGADDVITLTFTPTESKQYTFKCDTKSYAVKIKATWEGQSSAAWSEGLFDWAGATLTVDAVKDRVITLTITAADEESYPVTFPLELSDGSGDDDTPAEPWDGTTMAITLNDANTSKTFSYTATQNEMFYLFSKAEAYDVKFAGGVVGEPDLVLEWEAYDNLVGGYSAIKLMEGDVLKFTVTSTEFLEGQGADFPRKFSISSLVVPVSGFFLPGSTFENAVGLQPDVETIIPVNENTNVDEFPDFASYSELSWLQFTAPITGLANIDIEQYVLFVYEGEDKIGALDYKPMMVVQDENNNSHKFAVKANTTYYVVTTNNRPTKATLKLTEVEEGNDCIVPIHINSTTSALSVKAGATWYNYTITKSEDSALNLLELASNKGWTGTISYYVDCSDAEPVVNEVAAGAKSYFEMETTRTNYLICVNSANAVEDAIKLVQRDPKPGEAKVNPLNAKLGDNEYGGEKRNYWFKYIATQDCMLKLTYPEDALTMITLNSGTTNIANYGSTSCIVRVNAGEEYRMRFVASSTDKATFTVVEDENIPLGDYCDYPRPFNLDEDIVMKNRDAREEWYLFTAPDDGTVEFEVEDKIWVRDHWSCGIVKECGTTQDKLSFEELMGRLTYRYSVIKGETYRFTVYQFKNEEGADIVIKTKFTAAGEGESCDKAISIDFDKTVICKDVASETWYEFVAPEIGEYYLVSSLGQGAGVSYKINDCSTKATAAEVKDFMYGRAYTTLNLVKDQVVKICAIISKDKPEDQDYDYSLIVRKKAQGDDLETPFVAKAGEYYALGAGNVTTAATLEGYVYSITTTDDKLEFTILTKEAYFSGNFFVYYEGNRIGFTPAKVKTDNGDGTYTYTYTLTNTAIEAGKTYTVLFPFTVDGFNLGTSLITGIESTESSDKIIVCPNPNDGNFRVTLGELATNGALVEVINMAGVVIYKEYTTSTMFSVNLKGITAGVYFVRVYADGKNAVAKLIVR